MELHHRSKESNLINDFGFSPIVTYDYIGRTTRVLQKTSQNGSERTVNYDGIRRPTQLQTAIGPSIIVGFEHDYDAEDNKLNERKLHDSSNSELYAYDSAYRLIDFERGTLNASGTEIITPTTTTDALQNRNWTLDGVGNWQQNDLLQEGTILQTETRQHTNLNEIFSVGGVRLNGRRRLTCYIIDIYNT